MATNFYFGKLFLMCWKLNTKFCVKLADYEREFAPSEREQSARSGRRVAGGRSLPESASNLGSAPCSKQARRSDASGGGSVNFSSRSSVTRWLKMGERAAGEE